MSLWTQVHLYWSKGAWLSNRDALENKDNCGHEDDLKNVDNQKNMASYKSKQIVKWGQFKKKRKEEMPL